MKNQNILNLLNEAGDSNFVIIKWKFADDQSNANYSIENQIIYSTEVLKSNNCDCNDVYILVKGNISIIVRILVTEVAFKSCAPFTKCITKIDGTITDDAEGLSLVRIQFDLF